MIRTEDGAGWKTLVSGLTKLSGKVFAVVLRIKVSCSRFKQGVGGEETNACCSRRLAGNGRKVVAKEVMTRYE